MRRMAWAGLLCLLCAACGGDNGASESAGAGGSGVGGSGGGTGGAGGMDLPDYKDSPCWGTVGSTDMYNADTHMVEAIATTCRAEGEYARIYVVDSLWESSITQEQVNGLMHRLELVGHPDADDPALGILANSQAVFGALDATLMPDGKLDLFVLDIGGTFADGYMCGWCSYPQIHLDGVKLMPLNDDYALSVSSHELAHVIHRPQDGDEESWVDEALGEAGMLANGYMTEQLWLNDMLANTDRDWGPSGTPDVHYGGALLWGAYLYERGGTPLLRAVVAESANGWPGMEASFGATSLGSAKSHYLDMLLSTFLDRPDLGYGFERLETASVSAVASLAAGMDYSGDVQPYGADFITVAGSGSVQVTLTTPGAIVPWARAAIVSDSVTTVDLDAGGTLDLNGSSQTLIVISAEAATDYTISLQ